MSLEKSDDPPLNLPVFTEPQQEHWPAGISWEEAMQEFAARAEGSLPDESSTPEARFRSKNPERFTLV